MTNPDIPQTQTEVIAAPQRPDLGIELVTPAEPLSVSRKMFPWISEQELEISTVGVKLEGVEQPFRYGSLVGASNGVEKIARDVPPQNSDNAEQGMFKALNMMLRGETVPTVEIVPDLAEGVTVFKTTKHGRDVARLFFTLFKDENGEPVVLRLGIAPHKKQEAMVNVMRQNKNNRQKKDG